MNNYKIIRRGEDVRLHVTNNFIYKLRYINIASSKRHSRKLIRSYSMCTILKGSTKGDQSVVNGVTT